MPWEDQSGSSKNPWGRQGPQNNKGGRSGGGGGQEPPDLDEMLRKAQENFKGFMPGNKGSGFIVVIALVAIVALWLASGFYVVNPGESAVIQQFGEWKETKEEPGLGYHWPAPIQNATKLNVEEIRNMEIGFVEGFARNGSAARRDIPEESLMLTSDRNIVDLDLVIQWNIKSAEDFIFEIREQENTIKQVAQSAIREVVGQTNMLPIITRDRDAVANRAKTIIQENLDEYHSGVNITQVLIERAEVHPDVQSAFQDVQSAKQDAEDVQNRAEAYREDILPRARGEAIKMVQEAEAYKEATVAKANGDAERFNATYEAYLTGKDVTKQRIFLETMENVLQNANKIILDDQAGSGVVPYLPLDQLNQGEAQPRNNRQRIQ